MKTYMCVELLGQNRLPSLDITMLAFFRLEGDVSGAPDCHIDICWVKTSSQRCTCSGGRPWGEFVLSQISDRVRRLDDDFLREVIANSLVVVCGQFKDAWMLLHGIEPSCARCRASEDFFHALKIAQHDHDEGHDYVIRPKFYIRNPGEAYDEFCSLVGAERSVRNPYKG